MGIDPAIQLTRAHEARAWDGDKKSRSRSEGSEAPRVTEIQEDCLNGLLVPLLNSRWAMYERLFPCLGLKC